MKEMNETIYYTKGLAIFSVICAHCNAVLDEEAEFANICSLILQNIGTLGVICFFVISGTLFHYKNGQMVTFFKKRFFSICIPWIISASCVYLYVYLRKPPLSLSRWINFMIGNGSYCYYLTMLMVLYLIFTVLPFMRTNLTFIICEIMTVFSTIWFYQVGELSPYLYVVNWIGYFALGMQIAFYKDVAKELLSKLYKIRWVIIFIYIILLGLQIHHENGGWYWKDINVIVCWFGAITLILLAMMIEKCKNCWLTNIIYWSGKESFFIYIWHMPIAGIVTRIMCYKGLMNFVLFRPVVVLLIMVMACIILKWIIEKINLNQYNFIFGIGR